MKATEKIQKTAVELRSPKDGAEGPELMLSTLVQGLTSPQARGYMDEAQETGELDAFMGVLGKWILGHRSDDEQLLVVIELPRDQVVDAEDLVSLIDEARAAALQGPPDLSLLA